MHLKKFQIMRKGVEAEMYKIASRNFYDHFMEEPYMVNTAKIGKIVLHFCPGCELGEATLPFTFFVL